MNRTFKNAEATSSIPSGASLRPRFYDRSLALLAALCLFILPTGAKAACGSFGAPSLKFSVKLPAVAQADIDFPSSFEDNPTIVGLWHVIYTNSGDQSL